MNFSELSPETKLEPLMDDLAKTITFDFFRSASFKRWLISHKIEDFWNCTTEDVKSIYSRQGIVFLNLVLQIA